MICTHCKSDIFDDCRYCPRCGKPTPLSAEAAAGMLPPRLSGLVAPRRAASAGPAPAPAERRLRAELAAMAPDDRREALLTLVREHAATVLGYGAAAAVPADQAFHDLGFDSLTSVELRNRLGAATGVRLVSTVVFEHPTATALAAHLDRELPAAAEESATPSGGAAGARVDAEALLSEIETLNRRLQAVPPDDGLRGRIAARLHEMATACSSAGGADDLSTASFEELFDFIDNDLGRGVR